MEVLTLKSCEEHLSRESEYYMYSASVTARRTFFYPLCAGHFFYEPGYSQHRNSYDSFQLMYVNRGTMLLDTNGYVQNVGAGNMILIDCYRPHGYSTSEGWEAVWLHFDGPMARAYYSLIETRSGNVIRMPEGYQAVREMKKIYSALSSGTPVREAEISRQLTDILTSILTAGTAGEDRAKSPSAIEKSVSYIGEHFTEEISVDQLASDAMLSPYHFIRVFCRETGFTPHEYLINIRINASKYMLKNTGKTIKDICYSTGFSSESIFCTCFKKKTGTTPTDYRNSD
jgi:AraC family transcriptional regulator